MNSCKAEGGKEDDLRTGHKLGHKVGYILFYIFIFFSIIWLGYLSEYNSSPFEHSVVLYCFSAMELLTDGFF